MATDLEVADQTGATFRQRFLGQTAGSSVMLRHYFLDSPEHRQLREIADGVETAVRDELGDLLIPTAISHQWGHANPVRDRLDYVETVLRLHGWHTDLDDPEDPWLSSTQVARLLDIHPSKARERMADGRIEAELRSWGMRECWYVRRSVVDAYREAQESRIELNELAAELGISYHEAYATHPR